MARQQSGEGPQPIHNTQNGGKQRIEKRWKSRKQQARLRQGTAASDRVALLSGSAGEKRTRSYVSR